MIRCCAIGVFALLIAPAVADAAPAESFFQRYIAGGGAEAPCYARDTAVAEGQQERRLGRFFVKPARAGYVTPPSFVVAIGFTLVGSPDLYATEAECTAVGAAARCSAGRGDAQFTLSPNGPGLKVQIGNRLSAMGPEGMSPNLADGGDNMVILLEPGTAEACAID